MSRLITLCIVVALCIQSVYPAKTVIITQTIEEDGDSSSSSLIEDSIYITYTSTSQRDSSLQSVLGVWQPLFAPFGGSGLGIQFLREGTNSGGRRQVFYRINGRTTRPFNADTLRGNFQTAFRGKSFPGISLEASGSSAKTGSGIDGWPILSALSGCNNAVGSRFNPVCGRKKRQV